MDQPSEALSALPKQAFRLVETSMYNCLQQPAHSTAPMNYLYQSSGIPANANILYPTADEAADAPEARIGLLQDNESGFVNNINFNIDLVQYNESYQFDNTFSPAFLRHCEQIAALLELWCEKETARVVEVGCGKGAFVEILRNKGFNAVGYDNTYQGDSPFIRKLFFSTNTHEQGDLLVLRHVLEHIPNPWRFLSSLAEANRGKGYLYIEVPDLDWTLKNSVFTDFSYEHVNYFRLKDFKRIYGDHLVHAENTFGGQYLSLVISLSFSRESNGSPVSLHVASDGHELIQLFNRLKAREQSFYQELEYNEEIVIWGAAGKGVIFCCKAPASCRAKIAFAVDSNPGKQGLFLPISGVPVLAPEKAIPKLNLNTQVVILNPQYATDILQYLPEGQSYIVFR